MLELLRACNQLLADFAYRPLQYALSLLYARNWDSLDSIF